MSKHKQVYLDTIQEIGLNKGILQCDCCGQWYIARRIGAVYPWVLFRTFPVGKDELSEPIHFSTQDAAINYLLEHGGLSTVYADRFLREQAEKQ